MLISRNRYQSGNILPIILITVLLFTAVIAGVFIFLPRSESVKQEKNQIPSSPSTESVRSPKALVSSPNPTPGLVSPMGQDVVARDDTSKPGPWDADLMIGVSNDGNSFTDIKVFETRAGVPSIIHDRQGNLIAAMQWFPANNPPAFSKVAIKKSSDGGETWSDPVMAKFSNYPSYFSRPFDPTLVLTPEGKIRMIFTVNIYHGPNQKNDPTSYYSAISDDGVNYTFETGERFSVSGTQLLDPAMVYFRDRFFLTAPKSPNPGAYLATSNDGLVFDRQTDITSLKGYLWTGNLATYNAESSLRFYGASQNGKMFYSNSSDGLNWSNPIDLNLNGGDPAVVQVLESKYIILYVGPPRRGDKK